MKKTVFIFGALVIAVLTLLQISTYTITSGNLTIEIVIGIIAVLFFIFGMFWSRKQKKSARAYISEAINQETISALGITEREYEILVKISEGHTNKEIGSQLFISESTVKTHVSNLFSKLDVKRRTQAIRKSKALQILP